MGHERGTVLTELPVEKEELPSPDAGSDSAADPGAPAAPAAPVADAAPVASVSAPADATIMDFLKKYMNKILIYVALFVFLNMGMVRSQFMDMSFTNILGENNKEVIVSVILGCIGAILSLYLNGKIQN